MHYDPLMVLGSGSGLELPVSSTITRVNNLLYSVLCGWHFSGTSVQ